MHIKPKERRKKKDKKRRRVPKNFYLKIFIGSIKPLDFFKYLNKFFNIYYFLYKIHSLLIENATSIYHFPHYNPHITNDLLQYAV